jgi:hypothetical protein
VAPVPLLDSFESIEEKGSAAGLKDS